MISFFKHGSIQGTFLLANRVCQKRKIFFIFRAFRFPLEINVSVSLSVTQSLRVSIVRCHLTKGLIRITLARPISALAVSEAILDEILKCVDPF